MDDVVVRDYDPAGDRDAVHRIWTEIGWIEADNDRHRDSLARFLLAGRGIVGELDGEAEMCVTTADGTIRHGQVDLSMSAVTSVTASHVARQGGLASGLTARAVAADAAAGLQTAALGIFDQGFYDRLGFATGAAQQRYRFDPTGLRVPRLRRRPVRLGRDDAEEVHANRLATQRHHGACTITPADFTASEIAWEGNSFGLGFRDADGTLTHHLWIATDDMESGPYRVWWTAHRDADDLRELFGVLRSLADQVQRVDVPEPPGLTVQHLLDRPFRAASYTTGTNALGGRSFAPWQVRILDVVGCVGATSFPGPGVRFVLELDDPIAEHLPADAPWSGVAGRYTVELGERSSAVPGSEDPTLPVLRCDVGALTRLWLGVTPATLLPLTDDVDAPVSLLEQLDEAIRLPVPQPYFPF